MKKKSKIEEALNDLQNIADKSGMTISLESEGETIMEMKPEISAVAWEPCKQCGYKEQDTRKYDGLCYQCYADKNNLS